MFSAFRTTLSFFDSLIYMYKYQSWFKANQRWKSNVSEQRKSALNSAHSELFLSETALNFSVLNSADSEKIRADQRWCLSCSLNQRWKTSKLWNSAVQRWLPLGLQPGIVCPKRIFLVSPDQDSPALQSHFNFCKIVAKNWLHMD